MAVLESAPQISGHSKMQKFQKLFFMFGKMTVSEKDIPASGGEVF
ncbi:hypothetical protein [Pontiella desulfatans]|nr:hypothetical protein [Pontiella desulfatans]